MIVHSTVAKQFKFKMLLWSRYGLLGKSI